MKAAASDAAEAVREKLPEAETVKATAADAYEAAKDKANQVLGHAETAQEQAAEKIHSLCEETGKF